MISGRKTFSRELLIFMRCPAIIQNFELFFVLNGMMNKKTYSINHLLLRNVLYRDKIT